jgi:hypothetical protein
MVAVVRKGSLRCPEREVGIREQGKYHACEDRVQSILCPGWAGLLREFASRPDLGAMGYSEVPARPDRAPMPAGTQLRGRHARAKRTAQRRAAGLVLLAGLVLGLSAPAALGQAYLPPAGKIYAGATAGDPSVYEQQTGVHTPVFQQYVVWGSQVGWAVDQAQRNSSRLMLAVQLAGSGRAAVSPAQIAAGYSDTWLKSLGNYLFWRAQPTYLRLMAEMDDYYNPYCGFNADGSSRGPKYSPAAFRKAWKRTVLILRGGVVSQINGQLRRLGMPPVKSSHATLPSAPVAFLWVPATFGNPDIPANQPSAYYPGRAWVDWVGTDFFSKFPNWGPLDDFYRSFKGVPFAFGEWAVWGADSPSFVKQMFSWVRSHPRVRLLIYDQGYQARGPLSLPRHPLSTAALRGGLRTPVFAPFTAEWTHAG